MASEKLNKNARKRELNGIYSYKWWQKPTKVSGIIPLHGKGTRKLDQNYGIQAIIQKLAGKT